MLTFMFPAVSFAHTTQHMVSVAWLAVSMDKFAYSGFVENWK
jgi:hypothetical protein